MELLVIILSNLGVRTGKKVRDFRDLWLEPLVAHSWAGRVVVRRLKNGLIVVYKGNRPVHKRTQIQTIFTSD